MANKNENKWSRLPNRPPQIFKGKAEEKFAKHVSEEIIERVIGQEVLYYSIDMETSNYNIYGECIEKSFLPPLHIYVLVDWDGENTESNSYGVDRKSSLTIHFHRARLQKDQNLFVCVGDFVSYGNHFYEIIETSSPQLFYGSIDYKVEISAKCIRARDDLFNAS